MSSSEQMLDFRSAQNLILENVATLPAVVCPLADSFGSVLSEDVFTTFPVPRFDQTAVDGYALTETDANLIGKSSGATIPVAGMVRAGDEPGSAIRPGECMKVFTGAAIPEGTFAVVMIEDTIESDQRISVSRRVKASENIRRAGEELHSGALALAKGMRINSAIIGMAATLGRATLAVYGKPRVTLFVTGSELVEPGQPLKGSQIYNSNSHSLRAELRSLGLNSVRAIHCVDSEELLREAISARLADSDLIITLGGASVGDFDFVKTSIAALGGDILFDKVSIKPGKPTVFARIKDVPVIGLPGNPVSALVTHFLFARPAILKMMGSASPLPLSLPAILSTPVTKKAARTEFLRAVLAEKDGQLSVTPVGKQESHMLGGLVAANALIVFDGDPRTIQRDSLVRCLPLPTFQWANG